MCRLQYEFIYLCMKRKAVIIVVEDQRMRFSVTANKETKKQADAILSRLGLSTSTAISMFLEQVVLQQGLPFMPKLKNQGGGLHD